MGLVERSGVIYTKPGTIGYLYHDFNNPYDLVYHDGYFVVTTTVNNNPRRSTLYISQNGYDWSIIFDQVLNSSDTNLHYLFSKGKYSYCCGHSSANYHN